MGRIIFTDATGQAVLHNNKIGPANRFSNWKPNPLPFGDKANRQSDGALTRFKLRDDFGATFDITKIPVAASPLNLIEVDGDMRGTLGAAPTGIGTGGPAATLVLPDWAGVLTDGRPRGAYGFNSLLCKHVDNGIGGGNDYLYASAVVGHVYQLSMVVYVPTASTVVDCEADWEVGTSGTTFAHADLSKRNQWQILTATATATATTIEAVLRFPGSPAGAIVYSDLWQIVDLTAATTVRPVDIAERLAYHLENGGNCQVETGDADNDLYATCGLYPGASAPGPVLTDKQTLEHTLSLNLVNLAASPARMRCHYA